MVRLFTLCALVAVVSSLSVSAQFSDIAWMRISTAEARAVAISPDGTLVAAAGSYHDGMVKLWDARTGKLVRAFGGPNSPTRVAFSPDGYILAAIDDAMRLRFWSVSNGSLIRAVSLGQGACTPDFAFSPDGFIIAASICDTIRIVETSTGKVIRNLRPADDAPGRLRFTSDGKHVISNGSLNVDMWEVATGRLFIPLNRVTNASSIAISPDNHFLVTGGDTVKLWDLSTGDEIRSYSWMRYPNDMEFTHDGKFVVTASETGAELWNVQTGEHVRSYAVPSPDVGGPEQVYGLAISSDDSSLVTGTDEGDARIWRTATADTVRRLTEESHGSEIFGCIAFSHDGRLLVSDSRVGLEFYDAETGQYLPKSHSMYSFASFEFSPDDRFLAATWYRSIVIYDPTTGDTVLTASVPGINWISRSISWSPDGKMLASGGDSLGRIHIWNPADGSLLRMILNPHGSNSAVRFSPDGTMLAALSRDSVTIWSVVTWQIMWEAQYTGEWHTYRPFLEFSPDSKLLVLGTGDTTVHFWRVSDNTEGDLITDTVSIRSGAFNQDGRFFIAGNLDGSIKVWDVATHSLVYTYSEFPASQEYLAVSPGSRYIATVPSDGSLIMWRGQGGISDRESEHVRVNQALHVALSQSMSGSQARLSVDVGGPDVRTLQISILDILGRVRRSFETELLAPGKHVLPLDLTGLESGRYFCRVVSGTTVELLPFVEVR